MAHIDGTGFVGRSAPLGRLDAAVTTSAQGRRTAVLVSGEAGIGKTSLVRAALDEASADARLVGWGTCWHGDGAPGFWPWTQALDTLTRLVGHDAARAAAGQDTTILAALVRELGPAPASSDDPDRHRLVLLDAAVRWLETLATERHVVIVLDDLQWADSSTFDLLDHVTSTPTVARLLVVGTYRHDELDDESLARLARLGARADDIHLDGLSVEGVAELLANLGDAPVDPRHAAELHRRTGGHPLFVSELARLPEFGADGSLPTVVTGAVDRRLATLATEPRGLLDVASVLGNRLLPDVLGAVIDEPPATVLRLLDPAVSAGLVRASVDGDHWFAHDLYRETLYGHLDTARRSHLHGRVGDALEARVGRGAPAVPGDLAYHFTRAASTGDPQKAIRWAREAADDDRRRSAFAEAAGHLRRAREAALAAGANIEPGLLVRVLIDEADSHARSGEPDVARGLLLQAAAISATPQDQADVALGVQRLGAKFATPRDEIISDLESALESVTGVDVSREAKVTAALARELQHSVADDRRRSGPLSEAALALGRESGDDETVIDCLLARHDALWAPGAGAERAELGSEIAQAAGRLGDTDRLAEGLILEANGLLESGSPRFRPVLDRWFGLLEARDEPRDRYMVATRRAALYLLRGDTSAAEVTMHEAAAIGERIHEPDTGNVLMSQRVALARARNDPDELRALADDAVAWWTGAPVLAHAVAAGALASAGDHDAAGQEVAMVAESGRWQSEGSYLRSVLVAHLAEAAIALGDDMLCDALLTDVAPLAGSCGVNGAVVAFAGPFAHTAGILAGARGDRVTAARMLRASIETAEGLGAAVWARRGRSALDALEASDIAESPGRVDASLVRANRVWTVSWGDETGSLPHVKGLADIAMLVRHRGQEVSALQLAGGVPGGDGSSTQELIDLEALDAYRRRLDHLAAEIDEAEAAADIGHVERLDAEREQVLAEIRRATGLGGRLRTNSNDPAERARKAVSARVRDAIRRVEAAAPQLGAHLDRSIRTGVQCTYAPQGDDTEITWTIES